MVRAHREDYPCLAAWVQAGAGGKGQGESRGAEARGRVAELLGRTRKSRRGARLHCSPPPLKRLPVSRVHQRGEYCESAPPRPPYRSVQVPTSVNGLPPLNLMALESLHLAATALGVASVKVRSVTYALSDPPAWQAVPSESR